MRKLVLLLTLAAMAFGYYPWVRYNSRTGVYTMSPSKFDLTTLPNKTVYYFISESGPTGLLPGDSVAAIHSQIRAAAKVWNDVETSDLRVAFGGMRAVGAVPGNTPSIDVLFEELPPGVLSQGGPVLEDDDGAIANQAFIPILRSVVILPRNFPAISAPCPCPSWSEFFFTTVVHEFGHALGLQHSFSSGVMSQISQRGTTKAKPLGADDVAGVSWLYPTRAFASTFGSIAGRVTAGGAGVAYASVVALSGTGGAVSAMTNPDGTYRLEGLPAGQYVIYAHSLPPGADIRTALDADRREIPFPAQTFDTLFFPNSRNSNGAIPLQVRAGGTLDGVSLNVNPRRAGLGIHTIWTYSFPTGQVAVHPSHIYPLLENRNFVLAYGAGLLGANNQLAPGLTVSVVGGSPTVTGIRPYDVNSPYVRIDLLFNIGVNEGPYHLVFSTPNDTFVLPAGFTVVGRQAPSITSLTAGVDVGGRFLSLAGSGFRDDTRVMVDGVQASVRAFDAVAQRLVVTAPPAPVGHRGTVVALNSDGQSSAFSQSTPFTFSFDTDFGAAPPPPAALAAATSLPAGVESLVEITGLNTAFAEGQVQAGFHTSDAVVRRLWVVSPTRLLANVWVSPLAAPGLYPLTVTSGLSTLTLPGALQVASANPRQLSITPVAAVAGAIVPVTVNGYTGGALAATVADRPAAIVGVNGNVVLVQVPAGLPVGPAVLRLTAGADQALPIAISIEAPPPVIIAAFGTGNVLIDANRPARAGETIRLMTQGLSDARDLSTARVTVSIAGIEHSVAQIVPLGGAGGHEVLVSVLPSVAAGVAQTTVTIDGNRTSAMFSLPVRP